MSWIQLTSVTATNNSNVIVVNTGSTVGIKSGDALLLAGFDLVEVEGVFATQLQLRKPWAYATQSSVQAVVVPTFGDFNNAVEEVRNLRKAASDTLNELYANFVEKEEGKGLSTNDLTDELLEDINNKVDKEEGKGLSTNDYDNTAKQKVDEMGNAASRNVMTSLVDVTTPDALMPREAFGLGRSGGLPFLGFNTPKAIGWYYAEAVENIAGMPAGITGNYTVIVDRDNNYTLKQNTTHLGGRIFHGVGPNSITAPPNWREIYHSGRVLAAASQVGGIPTGGLMQYGQTPNGVFLRFAANVQISLTTINVTTTEQESNVYGSTAGVMQKAIGINLSYPAPFASPPKVTANAVGNRARNASVWARTATAYNYSAYSNGATQDSFSIDIVAIGPWY